MNGPALATRHFLTLLTIVVVAAALRAAQDVLIPLALALLLTFLLAPVVDRLHRWRVNRGLAVLVTVAIAFALIGGLMYVVFHQFLDLAQDLPQYRRQLRANIADLTGALRGGVSETTEAVEKLRAEIERAAPAGVPPERVPQVEVIEPAPGPLEAVGALVAPFAKPVSMGALVVVFVIFMLLRYADLRDRFIRLLGPRNLRATTEALDDAARRVSRYLIMQTLINTWQGVWVTIGLTLIGLPNAALWGALTIVLRFIPYLGPWMAAAMPVALSFAVFDNWTDPLLTIGLFVVLELVSNMVLEPWLYGSRTGVSPVALLVAAAFWTWLWGMPGLFLAIPLTVCLVVMGKYIPQLEFLHVLLGDQPVLTPSERLYQRLLAGNREEADELLEDALRTQSLLEVCDGIILPAMQLAESDYERGVLRENKRQSVLKEVEVWIDEQLEPARQVEGAPGPGVLCIPAADRADEISTRLLAAVLAGEGMHARALSRLQAQELGTQPTATAVVVCALPPDAIVHARHACKRARACFGTVPILVGLWCAQGDLQRSWQRLEPAGATRIVTSLSACLSQLRSLISDAQSAAEESARPVAAPQAHA